MGRVAGEEVLLLWRALSAFRGGPSPMCAPRGADGSPCPLWRACPRWEGPDDFTVSLEESPDDTERRRESWPCSRVLGLLGPDTVRIGR